MWCPQMCPQSGDRGQLTSGLGHPGRGSNDHQGRAGETDKGLPQGDSSSRHQNCRCSISRRCVLGSKSLIVVNKTNSQEIGPENDGAANPNTTQTGPETGDDRNSS